MSDSKGRHTSSAGKFFGRRLHKEKDKDKSTGDSRYAQTSTTESPPGSAHGSQSSRHSHRHSTSAASIDRPVSMSAEGIFARAGPISTIDAPRQGSYDDSSRAGEPLPHHLNKGGGDFHQYPIFNPSSTPVTYSNPGPPRPPPHSSTTIASSQPGDRGVSMQQWGARVLLDESV
jgi:cytokinesis protein